MPYMLKTVTTKPGNTQWWNDIDVEGAQRYGNFCRSFPGVLSVNAKRGDADPDNIWESEIVCESKDAMDTFIQACQTNSDWLARKAHLRQNKQTSVFTFLNT